ncbi:MAG: nitronate monooxygenase [Acidimicrobiaceae bacterium]|nr:nitronate monooxygenase [Acidimicrobiaceae bacterium]
MSPPWLIQGGMGIAISNWRLARAVASAGQLGVVSGTAIDTVFARRLQDHGVDDALRSVLEKFPVPGIVEDALHRFAEVRRRAGTPYKSLAMLTERSPRRAFDLVVLASFVEVALAKLGHSGLVGINLLTKVQIPTAASLCGAVMAGVDYVMMGAGVPTHIPGVIDDICHGRRATLPFAVTGAASDHPASSLTFDPTPYLGSTPLQHPKFVGIVSSHVLATALFKRSNGPVDGFVVERPSAGGHNAPPRGAYALDEKGGPIYGPRDEIDFNVVGSLGVPFWIGGGVTSSADVSDAIALGATGVQVGTMFAYCQESGMEPELRLRILEDLKGHSLAVSTSITASSTGYPFKVVDEIGTIGDPDVYAARTRKCDLGYLREAYLDDNGATAYRCAAEPLTIYRRKGGNVDDAQSTTCLCNGLMATCGLAQVRPDGYVEPALVTSGDRIEDVIVLLHDREDFSAHDVIDWLNPANDPCNVASLIEPVSTSPQPVVGVTDDTPMGILS